MADAFKSLGNWITFAGCVLVIAVLYWAQAVLVPVCLAVLLTFVLTPPVTWLQRRIGRVAAMLTMVILVFTFLGLAGYGVYRQTSSMGERVAHLSREYPREDPSTSAACESGGSVEKLEKTIAADPGRPRRAARRVPGTVTQPVSSRTTRRRGILAIAWLGPFLEPLSTAGFVVTLVLFMLLEREDLRDRLIGLFGHGQLAVTTKAIEKRACASAGSSCCRRSST